MLDDHKPWKASVSPWLAVVDNCGGFYLPSVEIFFLVLRVFCSMSNGSVLCTVEFVLIDTGALCLSPKTGYSEGEIPKVKPLRISATSRGVLCVLFLFVGVHV